MMWGRGCSTRAFLAVWSGSREVFQVFTRCKETSSSQSRMRRRSWLMPSTTPSATRKSAGSARLQVEERQAVFDRLGLGGLLDLAAFGSVKILGRPPLYFG